MAVDIEKIVVVCIVLIIIVRLGMQKRSLFAYKIPILNALPKLTLFEKYSVRLPHLLYFLATLFLGLGLSNIRLHIPTQIRQNLPTQGIALYLLIDRSSSMSESIELPDGTRLPKIEYVKKLTSQFIQGRPNDMIGLVAFARSAQIICPLTLDKETLFRKLAEIEPVTKEDEDGTAIGYGIYKTVNLIVETKHFADRLQERKKPFYTIKNQAVILLTDGLQSPNPNDAGSSLRFMTPEAALQIASRNDIRVYYVGVDPILASPQFQNEINNLLDATIETKGAFFLTTAANPLDAIYHQINALEKSALPSEEKIIVPERSLTPYFVTIALICLCSAILLETLLLQVVP